MRLLTGRLNPRTNRIRNVLLLSRTGFIIFIIQTETVSSLLLGKRRRRKGGKERKMKKRGEKMTKKNMTFGPVTTVSNESAKQTESFFHSELGCNDRL